MSNDTEKWMLQDFDSWVDATIISRGRSYYEYGSVMDLEQIKKNVWLAEVQGSHLYSVKVQMNGDFEIQGASCNCPYDRGPICKHIVAVLFDLQDQFLEADEHGTINPEQSRSEVDTGLTVEQELDGLISQISQDDLRAYVKEILLKDRNLRSRFMMRFSSRKEAGTADDYKKIIRDLLAPFEQPPYDDYYYDYYDEGYGYVGDDTQENYNMLVDLLDEAEQYLESDEPEKTILICKAMIQEVEASMAYVYDSDGSIWGLIDSAFELLFRVAELCEDEQVRTDLFEYSISNARRYSSGSGDRLNDFLELAVTLAIHTDQKERVEQLLLNCISSDQQKKSFSGARDFRKERLINKLAELYRSWGEYAKVNHLLEKHKDLPGIRTKLIEEAWEDKDLETVKTLAGEGKQKSEVSGYSNNQWTQWLLKAAETENDKKKQRKYAKELLFSTHNIDWYKRLKTLYEKEEWEGQHQSILKKFRKGHNATWFAPSIIPAIYIEEKQWKKLLEFVQQYSRLDRIREYDRWLKNHYFEELMELYRDAIMQYMENHTGRKYYRTTCEYFNRMRELGGVEEAYDLADLLKRQYSNRPAMLEEFEKAGY
ncbi:MAG: SWIM zinc finger family protein, partial [Balneolaceae bacterium]|nr:SWIM zinc finger family protein [Balneolaceae bacterium]